jgi:hypothetical protein
MIPTKKGEKHAGALFYAAKISRHGCASQGQTDRQTSIVSAPKNHMPQKAGKIKSQRWIHFMNFLPFLRAHLYSNVTDDDDDDDDDAGKERKRCCLALQVCQP